MSSKKYICIFAGVLQDKDLFVQFTDPNMLDMWVVTLCPTSHAGWSVRGKWLTFTFVSVWQVDRLSPSPRQRHHPGAALRGRQYALAVQRQLFSQCLCQLLQWYARWARKMALLLQKCTEPEKGIFFIFLLIIETIKPAKGFFIIYTVYTRP